MRSGMMRCSLVRSLTPPELELELPSPSRRAHLPFFGSTTSGFLTYLFIVTVFSLVMIYKVAPVYGKKNPVIYTSICSVVGSISVMAIKVSSRPSLLLHVLHSKDQTRLLQRVRREERERPHADLDFGLCRAFVGERDWESPSS